MIKEVEILEKKLNKAVDIIIELANKEFLVDEKAREIFRMCWLRYIEQELENNGRKITKDN